jgi:hypothetical protein
MIADDRFSVKDRALFSTAARESWNFLQGNDSPCAAQANANKTSAEPGLNWQTTADSVLRYLSSCVSEQHVDQIFGTFHTEHIG